MLFLNRSNRPSNAAVAVLVFEWELSGEVDPDGKPAITRHGIMQIVAVDQGGAWKILSAQDTATMPPV